MTDDSRLNRCWHGSRRESPLYGSYLTWYQIGEPLLIHTQPNAEPDRRPYGVCTLLIPALGARLTRNGVQAAGRPWAREREGRPFSTCALAFSESWTEAR